MFAHKKTALISTLLIASSITACTSDHGSNDKNNVEENQAKLTETDKINWVKNPVDFVNPFIGTEGVYNHRQAANVVPGAVLPHGMFNFGPEHAYTQDEVKTFIDTPLIFNTSEKQTVNQSTLNKYCVNVTK